MVTQLRGIKGGPAAICRPFGISHETRRELRVPGSNCLLSNDEGGFAGSAEALRKPAIKARGTQVTHTCLDSRNNPVEINYESDSFEL